MMQKRNARESVVGHCQFRLSAQLDLPLSVPYSEPASKSNDRQTGSQTHCPRIVSRRCTRPPRRSLLRHSKVLQKRLITSLGRRIFRNQRSSLPHKWVPALLLRLRMEVMKLGVDKDPLDARVQKQIRIE